MRHQAEAVNDFFTFLDTLPVGDSVTIAWTQGELLWNLRTALRNWENFWDSKVRVSQGLSGLKLALSMVKGEAARKSGKVHHWPALPDRRSSVGLPTDFKF